MTKIRTFYSLFLLIAFSSIGSTQPIFIASEDNVEETVNQIFELYESQISLNYDAVHNFVTKIVEGSNPDACENPYPKIKDINQGSIDFFWDPIGNAEYYDAAFLSLYTGEEGFTETSGSDINFSGLKGLVLFGFNTICKENLKSASGIVIVDLDILFPVPPGENNCECELMASIPFNPANANTQQAFSLFWPSDPSCNNSKYRVRVDGDLNPGSTSVSPYYSEITFIHGKASSPNVIYLLPQCDQNALSSAAPLRAGGLDYSGTSLPYYNTSFTSNYLTLTVPPSDLGIKDMFVDVCSCRGKGKGKGKNGDNRNAAIDDNPFKYISLAPNPSSDQVQVSVGLEHSTDVKIEVYDLLGKRIETLTRKNQFAAGQIQLNVDVQSWPKGVYSFHISSATQNKVLLFSKN